MCEPSSELRSVTDAMADAGNSSGSDSCAVQVRKTKVSKFCFNCKGCVNSFATQGRTDRGSNSTISQSHQPIAALLNQLRLMGSGRQRPNDSTGVARCGGRRLASLRFARSSYRSKPATLGALLAGAGGTNGVSGTYDKVGERLRGIPVLAHKFDGTQAV